MAKRPGTVCFFLMYSSVAIVSFYLHTTIAENIDDGNSQGLESGNIERKRREINDEFKYENKRQREFIGKRFRDFLGKRSDEDLEDMGFGQDIQEDINNDKRYRHFLGKRYFNGFDEDETVDYPEKRLREFIGKRSFNAEGRIPEEFVDDGINYVDDDSIGTYDKRFRELVGKRSYRTLDLSALEKRLRDFVGKRDLPYLRLGQNLFFRKPKYVRQLVGKRSVSQVEDDEEDEKRLREFVGKRMREFIGKRMREFVGKRSQDLVDKRLREFVGK